MHLVEMYKISTRQNTNWGIDGYEVPRSYFDHTKQLEQKTLEKL